MITKEPGAVGRSAFIAELRRLYQESGEPSYKRLAKISERVSSHTAPLYPHPAGVERRFPSLSVSAISEILGGKRKGLPSFDWVASFVLCCQRAAFEDSIGADPGTRTLAEWARRRAVYSGTAGPGMRRAGASPPRGSVSGQVRSVRLTPGQAAFVAGHGPYGAILVSEAEAGDAEAVYRVALLLGTDAAHAEEAQALLIQAAAAGHSASIELLDEHPAHLPQFAAARRAHDLGRIADTAGRNQAHAFYTAAARGGVPLPAGPGDAGPRPPGSGGALPSQGGREPAAYPAETSQPTGHPDQPPVLPGPASRTPETQTSQPR